MPNRPIWNTLSPKEYYRPRGQLWFQPEGLALPPGIWVKGGDFEEIGWSNEIGENKIYSAEYPDKKAVYNDIFQAEPEFDLQAKMMTSFLLQVGLMSEVHSFSQSAANAQTVSFTIGPDEGFELPHRESTISSFTVTEGQEIIEYVHGTHYQHDVESGHGELIRHPDGVTADANGRAVVEIDYAAAAITALKSYGMNSKKSFITKVKFVQNNKLGRQIEARLNKVDLRYDGKFVIGSSSDEIQTMNFKGTCYDDLTMEQYYETGRFFERKTRSLSA